MELLAFLARVRHPTWSPERWYEAYREARRTMDTVQTDPFDEWTFNRAYDMRVRATWALASFGARGLPFALQLTKSKNADDRANATGILEAAAEDPAAVVADENADPDTATSPVTHSRASGGTPRKGVPGIRPHVYP